MKISRSIICLLGIWVTLGVAIAAAQSEPMQAPTRILDNDSQVVVSGLDSRLGIVRQLIAQGAYISAINLLETYYAEEPNNETLVDLMLNCYGALKDNARAEALLRDRIARKPLDYRNQYLLLDLYLRMGADSMIDEQVRETERLFPGNPDIVNSTLHLLINYGEGDRALKMIQEKRKEFKNNSLFALEMASILELKGSYYDAVLECFRGLGNDTVKARDVDRKIAGMIRLQGAPPEVIRGLKAVLDSLPNNIPALRMLNEAYIKNNQLTEAYQVTILLDSLTQSEGRELFLYMRQCRERKLYDQVLKTAEYIDRKYASNWSLSEYKFYYAEALAGVGRFPEAIAQYKEIAAKYPQPRDQAEALLEIGNIYRYNLRQYDSARVYYRIVSSAYAISSFDIRAALEMAKMLMVEGKLDSAEAAFSNLQKDQMKIEVREFVDYTKAMILLFRNQFDEANTAFRRVIENYPRGFYVNDALVNSLIIGEASGSSPDVLTPYAEALFFENRLMPDSVENRLQAIIAVGDSPLSGQAIYKLAQFYIGQEDTLRALGTIEEAEKLYPQNYFFPYCMKLKGDIFFGKIDGKKQAAEIYKTLLEKFGNYPFIGEVRLKLQELEGYRLPG
jgi:tetratricopeptide (TPR) repeat protein